MRIDTLWFKDYKNNWELSETSFDKLTLLVGASGVGKSRILQCIDILKKIASGRLYSGIEWSVKFATSAGDNYVWTGKTDESGDFLPFGESMELYFLIKEDKNQKENFESEEIYLNDKLIVSRTPNETIFNDTETVKFSLNESIVSILKEEEQIKPIIENFRQIRLDDHSSTNKRLSDFDVMPSEMEKLDDLSIENIRTWDFSVIVKLYFVFLHHKDFFQIIKDRYIDIFPLVEDMQVISKEVTYGKGKYLNVEVQIKEKGVDTWIKKADISSGMYRSLIHIAEIYLCENGTVFLIDEFENSLGVNCINELTEEIISTNREVQFIITSHHPYIINNIDFSHWKLVVRNGSVVKTLPVTDLIRSNSSHDKFMQLIQLSQYQTGEDLQ